MKSERRLANTSSFAFTSHFALRPSYFVLPLLLCCVACGEESTAPSAPPAPRPAFFLITDYLPIAIYDGDALSACFRIENTTDKEAALEMAVTACDDAGVEISRRVEKVKAPARGFGSFEHTLESRRAGVVKFLLQDATGPLAQCAMRVLREHKTWPETRVRNGRLETAEGEILLPVVRKQLRTENRAYTPLSWLLGRDEPAPGAKLQDGMACLPACWQLAKDRPAGEFVALGPYGRDGCMPLLRALADVLSGLRRPARGESGAAARVAIFLPPEDLDVGSDPRTYRIVLDALAAHLKNAGAQRVVLVPPLHYGAPEKHRLALWREVHECAAAYSLQSVDPAEHLNESLWRADPDKAGVYGIRPNEAGIKKIEQALRDWLR